ncbi:MAG TPA: MXAN_5187 C-terminal domain-containing protein [Bryobacteraceae bacterium]|nr:MXAN_5187 C-terminal domain-containing protein [Bryobacteraceae bacterium]
MTIDEELTKLDENIRRLKIEYEAYFNGGAPRAPHDTLFRVETAIRKYHEAGTMNFGQRFRFNQLVQKYVVHNDLWRKKLKEKEEGRGRFAPRRRGAERTSANGTVCVVWSDPSAEKEKVDRLLKAVVDARRKVGEAVNNIDPLAFAKFVGDKTKQIRDSLRCEKVQFSVSVKEGKVKLKAGKLE